jgi:threonyl-tRNA synthetase
MGDYAVSQSDYGRLEKEVKKYTREKQHFERALLTKQQALELFEYNPFKSELIQNKVPDGALTSVYRCGQLIDLCMGPHISSSDKVKGFKIVKNSAAYWHGQKDSDGLQRVYGVSYPKQSQLEDYLKRQEELAKKDHRHIGLSQ